MLENSPLGEKTVYLSTYTPSLLFPLLRSGKRKEIGIGEQLPFSGYDLWNSFEMSWLNSKGKPVVALGEFVFPCDSPNLVESKSFKLYLNSLNNSRFESIDQVNEIVTRDLTRASGASVRVRITAIGENTSVFGKLSGLCLDDLDIEMDQFEPDPRSLSTASEIVGETLHSHLLKSNCPVTGQPDWGSIQIVYQGPKIIHESLLKYIVSLRNHNEFHEQCVERIFMDIQRQCQPRKLSVYARYTRRGGLDINPFRTSELGESPWLGNDRLIRQ